MSESMKNRRMKIAVECWFEVPENVSDAEFRAAVTRMKLGPALAEALAEMRREKAATGTEGA